MAGRSSTALSGLRPVHAGLNGGAMFDGNAWINDFIGKNWMLLILLYNMLTVIFPDSAALKAIGQSFSRMFPVFRTKGDGKK